MCVFLGGGWLLFPCVQPGVGEEPPTSHKLLMESLKGEASQGEARRGISRTYAAIQNS